MNGIVIFSGTTEGRMLAQTLSENGIHCIVSVATEYGEIVMPEMDGVTVHKGRMDLEEMQKFIAQSEVAAGGGCNASVCNGSFGKHQGKPEKYGDSIYPAAEGDFGYCVK
ncbi:MAG: precorrin-6A/cobalt-precorrin-6A reductase [Roseburia inulinivorans]